MTVKTGVSLPDDVYSMLLDIAESRGYKSVSQAIRDAVTLFVVANRWWGLEGRVAGAFQVLLKDDKWLGSILSRYRGIIRTHVSVPLTGGRTIHIVVVEGPAGEAKRLYSELVRVRGVLSVQPNILPV
ncbi:MAG: hypothetical protein LRS48_00180 [Desulfurococcales archaeon]|nr:hypothetical protein [Desulfurococcales archaeon]